MRHGTSLLILALAFVGCDKPSPPSNPPLQSGHTKVPPEKRVSLAIRAKTWREGQRCYDIEPALRAKLADHLIEVVPEGSPARDGAVQVEYTEAKGQGYSHGPLGDPIDWGTNVAFTMTLTEAKTERTLLSLTCNTSPSFKIEGKTIYQDSVDRFLDHPTFANSGLLVAAALNVKGVRPRILRALVRLETRQAVVEALKESELRPADAREEAILALGRENYDRCVAIGTPAVEPLLDFVTEYEWPPDKVVPVILALGRIGDPKPASLFLKRARLRSMRMLRDPGELDVIRAYLEALGRIGDRSALEELAGVAKSDDKRIADAASAAAAEIRKRAGK